MQSPRYLESGILRDKKGLAAHAASPFFAGRRPEPIVIGDVVRRRPFIVHRRRFRCGVPPRLTRTDNIASSTPRLVEENPSTASGPPPLRRGGLRPNRGHRRGRPLTSQTAFGGQLPYEGSLGRPAVNNGENTCQVNVAWFCDRRTAPANYDFDKAHFAGFPQRDAQPLLSVPATVLRLPLVGNRRAGKGFGRPLRNRSQAMLMLWIHIKSFTAHGLVRRGCPERQPAANNGGYT